MRKLALVLLFGVSTANAAPFLVADVTDANANVCSYKAHGTSTLVDSPVIVDAVLGSPANGNRICKVDLVGSPVGTNNVELSVKDSTGVWGPSAAVPFSFARPDLSKPGVGSIRLVP